MSISGRHKLGRHPTDDNKPQFELRARKMSARKPAGLQSVADRNSSYEDLVSNPFETVFDGEDVSDEEWWDEEENTEQQSTSSAETTRQPQPPKIATASQPNKSMTHASVRKVDKRYSVVKPRRDKSKGRQRKQNALAGIKVVTNFSKHAASTTASQPGQVQQSRSQPQVGRFVDLAALQALEEPGRQLQTGCFVDLAALQALDGGQPLEGSGALATFWKSRMKGLQRAPNTVPSMSNSSAQDMTTPVNPRNLAPQAPELDLSPSDRPIVIGFAVPSANLAAHSLSPQTAVSSTTNIIQGYEHRTPQTPTIIITPAHAGSIWSALEDSTPAPGQRPASSIYSIEPSNSFGIHIDKGAPPVPQMPAGVLESERQRAAAEKSYFSPDSDAGTSWEDVDVDTDSSPRPLSTGTLFEEDDSPVLTRSERAVSMTSPSEFQHSSTNTIDQRRSKGWWNYILNTPFISRSNTATQRGVFEDRVPPPAMPDLTIAAAKVQEAECERDGKIWEKQFSPLTPTPNTATTAFSDTWWDMSAREDASKHPKSVEQSPRIRETRHKAQLSNEAIPAATSYSAVIGNRTTTTTPISNPSARFASDLVKSDRQEAASIDSRQNENDTATNPYKQPRLEDINHANGGLRRVAARREPPQQLRSAPGQTALPTPPPPYSPDPALASRKRGMVHQQRSVETPRDLDSQYPASPGPMTPGLQLAMGSRSVIPMSEVPLTPDPVAWPPVRPQYPNLPQRQEPMVFDPPPLQPLSAKARKAEMKRRRHEKEDAAAHRAGGWWRGRGCIPDRGCYGRKGAEGRKRRRCYCGLIGAFLFIIILAIVLATTLHRKPNTVVGPSQWLNLTGFPPIFTGLSTVVSPANIEIKTGCVIPSTEWSCDLPKELHNSVAPNPSNQPNFLLNIQWDNSSATNATFANVTGNSKLVTRAVVGNPVFAGQFMKHLLLKARQVVSFAPNPAPPSFAEGFFLGNTTDGIVSSNKAGELTPFYISFLSPTGSSSTEKRHILARADSQFPNITDAIPAPSTNKDGTAQAANLLPLPSQQPIRLYDRGLPTEHYGFYTYFDRSIFLKSTSAPDGSGLVPADKNGGATKAEAAFRCTWAETRFLVQMWTHRNATARLLNSTLHHNSSPATDFTQPGSFPYPVTITVDRHGGDPTKKMVYCYALDARGAQGDGKIMQEFRDFGGSIVNPAANIFFNESDPSLGGFDGGNSGCSCQWSNFVDVNV